MFSKWWNFYASWILLLPIILVTCGGCQRKKDIGKPPQCGQHCIHRICQLLGVPIGIDEICSICPPKNDGESLKELEEAFISIGLKSHGLYSDTQSAETLLEIPRPFIASLSGHFIVVDAFDKTKGVLRVFDVEGGRRLAAMPSFLDRWDGYALVVSRPDNSHRLPKQHYSGTLRGKAIAEYGSLYLDAGDIDPEGDGKVEYTVNVRNSGTEELHILAVKSDCSCVSISTQQKNISSGASGKIKLIQDVGAIRGPYEKHVIVQTNDTVHPIVQVTLAGNAAADLVLSHSRINFGNIQVDDCKTVDVYVRYTGDKALVLEPVEQEKELEIKVLPWDLANDLPSVSNSIKQRFNTALQPKSHIGWSNVFRVSASITADEAELGKLLSGEIKMNTNLKSMPVLSIPYVAKVSEPCWARPSTLFFENVKGSDSIIIDRVVHIAVPENEQWTVDSLMLSEFPFLKWKLKDGRLSDIITIQVNGKLSVRQAKQTTSLDIKLVSKAEDQQHCVVSIPVRWRIR